MKIEMVMKMMAIKKLLLAVVCLASWIGAMAQDGVSLIREDRIWEYYRWIGEPFKYEILQLKFDGTEVVDGKEYSLLQVVKHIVVDFETHECFDRMPSDGTPGTGFYEPVRMRESDGRVYRLYNDNWNDRGIVEAVVWDFNLAVGDELSDDFIIGNGMDEGYNAESISRLSEEEFLNLEVIDAGTEVVDGLDCRYLDLCMKCPGAYTDEYYTLGYYRIVEGIGPVKNNLNTDYRTTDLQGTIALLEYYFERTAYPLTGYLLNNVYNLEGDVIYAGEGYDWVADSIGWTGIDFVRDSESQPTLYDLQGRRINHPTGKERILKVSPDGKSAIVF